MNNLAQQIAAALETSWAAKARPDQLPPQCKFSVWLVKAGRGWGKTATGANWVIDRVNAGIARRIAIVGPTAADTRDIMVEGVSGIMASAPDWNRPVYEPSKRRITWPCGAVATCYSADEADRLRGQNSDTAWCDELGSFRHPTAWDMLLLGLRLGENPQCIVTTTPRPTKLIRDLMKRPDVVITGGSSYENKDNLSPQFFSNITARYAGTRLGRQELNAELLEDTPGALWNREQLDALRLDVSPPELSRIVIGIDPSGSAADDEDADECGIVAAGVDHDGRGYVLADESGRYAPTEWAQRAVALYHRLGADRLVAEVNYGGAMVEATIRAVDPNVSYKSVTASRGKVARAEPIAALYEQKRVAHLGEFPELEDEMCGFTTNFDPRRAGFSPGRVDALVWCLTELMSLPMEGHGIFEYTRRRAEGLPIATKSLLDVYNEARVRIEAGSFAADTRTDERKRLDAIAASATPSHPDARGGPVEFINGPLVKPNYARGSVEFAAQQRGKP